MFPFNTVREAKRFLVGRIAAEAERNGILLSDIEQKMMYFSETGWTLDDMNAINAAFEISYDQAEYEKKIAQLIREVRAHDRDQNNDAVERWKLAEQLLRTEDHYLLALIDLAGGRISAFSGAHQNYDPNRMAKVLIYGIVGGLICGLALAASMLLFR